MLTQHDSLFGNVFYYKRLFRYKLFVYGRGLNTPLNLFGFSVLVY